MKHCTLLTKNILAERVYLSRIHFQIKEREREKKKLHSAIDIRANEYWIVEFASLGMRLVLSGLTYTNLYGEVFETLTKSPACLGGIRLFENALCAGTTLMACK
jgi:hypothetical protein